MKLSFPDVCRSCGEGFKSGEARIGIVRAGRDLEASTHELLDGMELYRTETYHERHAPPSAEKMQEVSG